MRSDVTWTWQRALPFFLATSVLTTPVRGGGPAVDAAPLFEQLEAVGMDTSQVRALFPRLKLWLDDDPAHPASMYRPFDDTLEIPMRIWSPGSEWHQGLSPADVATIIGELTVAAYDLKSDSQLGEIVSMLQVRAERIRTSPQTPLIDAVQSAAAFMNSAVFRVLATALAVTRLSEQGPELFVLHPGDEETLGVRFVLPAEGAADKLLEKMRAARYWSVDTSGRGDVDSLWSEDPVLQQRMFGAILGLRPPPDVNELLLAMNRSSARWIVAARERARQARNRRSQELLKEQTEPLEEPSRR